MSRNTTQSRRNPPPARIAAEDLCAGGLFVFVALLFVIASPPAVTLAAEEPNREAVEFFEKSIRPIFARRCFECHSGDEREGGLQLDSKGEFLRGGDSGAVVAPGEPEASRLIHAIGYEDVDLQMPPDGKLTDEEIDLLVRWVRAGARWPGESPTPKTGDAAGRFAITDEDRAFWSLVPPRDARLPEVRRRDWPTSPVDYFVLRALEQANLQPAPPADRRTLLRRVYLDLIGLPPTSEEIEAFLLDRSPDAYERVVDRLLSSPHYGERWARHWLDVVRYSDTAGHVQDHERPQVWRYRDYVIDALNSDLAYDRFVMEHIAGDLIEKSRPGTRGESNVAPIATGFLWFHEMHYRSVDPVLQRADQVDAQIDVIGKAFLGLTLACARCHDHKFDPISQRDYYALAGFLHSSHETHAPISRRVETHNAGQNGSTTDDLEAEIQTVLDKAMRSATEERSAKTSLPIQVTEDNFSPGQRDDLATLRGQLAALDFSSSMWAPSALDTPGGDVALHIRGSHQNLGPAVPRRFLEILSGDEIPQIEHGSGRRYLAQKIADPQSPLITRVQVNRLWQHHFGSGLVRTPNNFGRSGERPTHPKLLDYLATEFIKRGWSNKAIHRLIVCSSTYRMSSEDRAEAVKIDPENRLLHHMPVRRLDAEVIRDSMLLVSGMLNHRMFGRGEPPYVSPNVTSNKPGHIPKSGLVDENGRRSIYIMVRRNFLPPFLVTFDFPDPGASAARRDSTIVPSQALAMLNSPFAHQQAARWGKRVAVWPGTAKEKITRMYLEALGREPSRDESAALVDFLRTQRSEYDSKHGDRLWGDVAHVIFNHSDLLFVR